MRFYSLHFCSRPIAVVYVNEQITWVYANLSGSFIYLRILRIRMSHLGTARAIPKHPNR